MKHDSSENTEKKKIRRSAWVTVICDVVIIIALLLTVLGYINRNNANTYSQNTANLSNIAAAKSELMDFALGNASQEVKNAYNYCAGKSEAEALDYLSLISDAGSEYQLLMRDENLSTDLYHVYSGYSTAASFGTKRLITYKDNALASSIYSMAGNPDGRISFSQVFTNETDTYRYFAAFCGITLYKNSTPVRYYLVKPQKQSVILDQLITFTQYSNLSTAVCYSDGKFLASDNGFRNDNFFDYLRAYNNDDGSFSLSYKETLKQSVINDEDGIGTFQFNDYKGRPSVFAYSACKDDSSGKYVIISLPVSDFVSEKLFSFFPLIIIAFLAVLLCFNIIRLVSIVKKLQISVEREQIANKSKSSFLSKMSHEIRTPLNAVIGYNIIARNEMSSAKTDIDRKQAEMKAMDCLTKSEIASKHLLTIINDVLDMSAIESGRIQVAHESFDFKGLITSLTTVFYSQAKSKGVQFDVVFASLTEEWFIGDQMRTNQILTNLLSNAIKFTPEGGFVTLTVSQPQVEEHTAVIHFEISDTGIGMSEEYLGHIWTPFEQADSTISRRFGGTGLGLSITKSLVELMHGNISVSSALGKGTTFSVDLTFERTPQPVSGSIYNFSAINALIVDDDVSTCEYIRMLFNRCGARCTSVTRGEDAIKAVTDAIHTQDVFTVCLIDWRMPGMDGLETIKRLRALNVDIPILVITAYDFSEIADEATKLGITRFISKPLFQSSLFDFLADVGGVPINPDIKAVDAPDFTGMRVMLTEDNAMNMEIAKKILETVGITVDQAWNGREATEIFEASAPGTYMAILMDVHMPEMDGHEATRIIRASSHPDAKQVPIIAMTADAFTENAEEARAAGMNGLISKPIDLDTLFGTLKKYIRR